MKNQLIDIQAEKAVLGSVLLDGKIPDDIRPLLKPEAFSIPEHALLWRVMTGLDTVDVLTMHDALSSLPPHDVTNVMLTELIDHVPSSAAIREYALIVQRAHLARTAYNASTTLSDSFKTRDTSESLAQAVEIFTDLKTLMDHRKVSSDAAFDEALRFTTDPHRVTPWGIPILDFNTAGGLKGGEVALLAGQTGEMKTSFVMDRVRYWLDTHNRRIFINSKEMPTAVLLWKLVAPEVGIPVRRIITGSLTEQENGIILEKLHECKERWRDKLFISEDAYSIEDTESYIRSIQPDIFIDDFIQMSISGNGKIDARFQIADYMRMYKRLAKQFNAAGLVISQMNRAISYRTDDAQQDETPRLSDLSESGSLERLASEVVFISYPYKRNYDPRLKNKATLYVAKSRYGESGKVYLSVIPELGTFRPSGSNE